MADPTIAYIKTLAEEAIAARDLANDCLPVEYHDYSTKAMAAHEKYREALGKLQPDDFLAKLALTPPQDVAELCKRLHIKANLWRQKSLQHSAELLEKAANTLLSQAVRIAEMETKEKVAE